MTTRSRRQRPGLVVVRDAFVDVHPEAAARLDALQALAEQVRVRVLNVRLMAQRRIAQGDPVDLATLKRAVTHCEDFDVKLATLEHELRKGIRW